MINIHIISNILQFAHWSNYFGHLKKYFKDNSLIVTRFIGTTTKHVFKLNNYFK